MRIFFALSDCLTCINSRFNRPDLHTLINFSSDVHLIVPHKLHKHPQTLACWWTSSSKIKLRLTSLENQRSIAMTMPYESYDDSYKVALLPTPKFIKLMEEKANISHSSRGDRSNNMKRPRRYDEGEGTDEEIVMFDQMKQRKSRRKNSIKSRTVKLQPQQMITIPCSYRQTMFPHLKP